MQTFLLLHGFTGSPESWDDVLTYLPGGREIHCPALVGHDPRSPAAPPRPGVLAGPQNADAPFGSSLRAVQDPWTGGAGRASSDAIASHTFEAEVDRLAAALRQPVRRDTHVVGYSQGGRLALGLLVRHPDLFAAATLIGASPGLESEDAREARRESDEQLARRLEQQGLERFLDFWQSLPLFASQRSLPQARLETQRALRLRHRPQELARALRVLGLGQMPNYWNDLAGLDLPIRLMVGELDEKFRRIAERMNRLLPRASLEVVEHAGHNLLLEAPSRVAAVISSFPES